ncbi:pentapeptide repeat-containing protein [Argonema galeatum]|uniref:pentapeptide repeat-containing protein n=1 Tax=Argonema galeatum TaxID=2942762 RepID=UPI0020125AAF|nr:pentapeptide repeat-containing protein [Argonema galeatum]MCL1464566.1 pentapeptide repeat-containing protein [Argonema galeatum A003/A1]
MTVEEALELVEIAIIDYQRLNKVQELVFRQSWEGWSYAEIAKNTGYNHDYIKATGYELWKLLSKALGEKVKKDNLKTVLKRYIRKNQVNLHGNHAIELNLSGANLSGASLSVTRICANLIESNLCQANLPKSLIPENNTESDEEADNQEIQPNSEEEIYYWNDLPLRSQAQVKIAEALDRANVLFIPNSKARLTTTEGRQNQEPEFLIFHQGKWGILEIDSELSEQDVVKLEKRDRTFQTHGIAIVQHYDATQCREQPDRVVQDFLAILTQIAL